MINLDQLFINYFKRTISPKLFYSLVINIHSLNSNQFLCYFIYLRIINALLNYEVKVYQDEKMEEKFRLETLK